MTIPDGNSAFSEETDADRQRGILAEDALSVDLVSAFAGDRSLTETEKKRLLRLQHSRGLRFYSDILYAITHQYFAPEVAEDLWKKILQHKRGLLNCLGRNVRITVAALDYLSNITDNLDSATIVGEENIGEIVGLSLRDGLTGLFNHSYFYQQLDLELKRSARYGVVISLILIDVDDFKQVNDTYGHREGDRVLAAMGKALMHVARDSDICCRYGGDEFAVILPLTDLSEANAIIANRLLTQMMERLPCGHTVTVSMGASSCGKEKCTSLGLVEKADAALYQAKRDGKNRTVVSEG